MVNPIPARVRGMLYVAAILVGAVGATVTAVVTALGATEWLPVVASVTSVTSATLGILARDNLDLTDQTD